MSNILLRLHRCLGFNCRKYVLNCTKPMSYVIQGSSYQVVFLKY